MISAAELAEHNTREKGYVVLVKSLVPYEQPIDLFCLQTLGFDRGCGLVSWGFRRQASRRRQNRHPKLRQGCDGFVQELAPAEHD